MSFLMMTRDGKIANTDPETGVRYGVISFHRLEDWVIDEIFTNGENLSFLDAQAEAKKEYEREAQALLDADGDFDFDGYVEEKLNTWNETYESDDDVWRLETDDTDDGGKVVVQTTGPGNLFVFMSPVIVNTRLCSPCYPNAGNLDSPDPDGYETYGLPKNWLEKNST